MVVPILPDQPFRKRCVVRRISNFVALSLLFLARIPSCSVAEIGRIPAIFVVAR
jgi:hypothetical protein